MREMPLVLDQGGAHRLRQPIPYGEQVRPGVLPPSTSACSTTST
ncbi:hypothetical protein JOD54_003058 [Actinokineospora baliensis]|nr:hypothetical protein [Actinokineospora baliensis]MBM7772854.1 hypothetical protein [Actinokineospora baliensis]